MPNPPLPVAEIVTFTLTPGSDPDRFAHAAAALDPWLAAAPGFLGRSLSCGPDGIWTDHVLWADLSAATAAAEVLPARPEAAAFLAAIDPASVAIRHAPVVHRQPA
ncbi:MAG: hypothetical protein MUF73_06430 [Rhodobacteraceae bacterium]|jgi:hypothetical protein|nr:hypothetical protein [Paracoccaceae bacterium]